MNMTKTVRLCAALTPLLVAASCEPDLPHTPPQAFVSAVFDPTTGQVPLPNDLVFLASFNSVCPAPYNALPAGTPPRCAQAELLASFGGQFPNDQEVAITVDFTQTNFDASGKTTQVAPSLDLTTFTPSTLLVFAQTPGGAGPVVIDPITDADYAKFADHGTLTLHNRGHAPWAPGSYAVFIRGGDAGVHTTDKIPVTASQIFDLIAQGRDLTDPANLGLLKAKPGATPATAADQGKQLALLITLYKTLAFPIVDPVFPHEELAIATTFKIDTATNVPIDPARGAVPLPIDLLRGPTGTLTPLAACTLAGSTLAADGTCPNPAAAGFLALDGFSTTGAILAPTSELVQAASVTSDTVKLYDLSTPAQPTLVPSGSLIFEPCEFASACGSTTALSPVIALQPAGATAGDPTSVFRTKPLKDNTDYAVVITTGVHDKAGRALGSGTVAKILGFTNPIVVGGHSALQNIDDATAAGLERMRLQLVPVYAALATAGTQHGDVAMAYTFHTQTILDDALKLTALPYVAPGLPGVPVVDATHLLTVETAPQGFARYGATGLPSDNIDEILEVDIVTANALDLATGAFLADPTMAAPEFIHVLIATPKPDNAAIPACQGALAPLGKCAPLMVFRHGLGRGRADMLAIADSYAAAGMITVAIDAAKHGDRSYCTSGTTGPESGCISGTCTALVPVGAQGDAHPIGTCGATGFIKAPLVPNVAAPDGVPVISGNYLVSSNFFRTRDTLRQDLIDESQLIRTMAFVPTGPPPSTSAIYDQIFTHSALATGHGLLIDPTTIYFSSQSLGSIQGTMDVATNPRISKAAFNVGGGTVVDIFTQSPAFASTTNQLLAGLGIQPGTAAYLQFLVVAKTVLDPADPINFAGHLLQDPLPNLLSATPPLPKKILTQNAYCDAVVPNFSNFLWASNIGTSPLPPDPTATTATGTAQMFFSAALTKADLASCAIGAVKHGFLLDWQTPLTAVAQHDIANFMMSGTLPLSVPHL
jgi:hypothetical protein